MPESLLSKVCSARAAVLSLLRKALKLLLLTLCSLAVLAAFVPPAHAESMRAVAVHGSGRGVDWDKIARCESGGD